MSTQNEALYKEKLSTPQEAAALIPSGTKLALALGVGQPPALMNALAERARAGQVENVRIYYMLAAGLAGKSIFDYSLNDKLIPMSIFHGGVERALDKALIADGLPPLEFLPSHFSQIPRLLTEHVGVEALIATVSPMDANGNFSLGTDADYALAVMQSGAKLILEVNPHMPYVHGDCMVHVSQVSALVEHAQPLIQLPPAPRTDVDDAIGAIIAGLVKDGDCLQMGIGALPDAVCASLNNHKNMGVHTEMMTSGLAALMKAGVIDNSRKQINPGRSVFAFAMGDQALYDYLHDNPAIEAHPVNYVNDPAVICRNDNVVSVNATLQIDFHGACNSEYVGGRQFSASGGQLDFVRGAYASKGGRSIIACHSTAAKGTISRIATTLDGPVTTPRNETHIVVTEYGWINLKGKSLSERAEALISIAHPDFRDQLTKEASELGLRPRKFHPTA